MEYEKIKDIIKDMGESKLSSLEVEFADGTKLKMTKDDNTKVGQVVVNNAIETCDNVNAIENNSEKVQVKKEDGKFVKSPMVGTFYSKSSPKAEPFVKVGDTVKKGDVVCIIEAMKLMNEIESEFDGKVEEVLVKDDDIVEYGMPLFRIV